MIYPPETSLIPVTVSLSRFFMEKGFGAFFADYPYWYLGTTPFKYLTGPVVPIILGVLNRIFGMNLFTGSILIVLISFIAGGVGWLIFYKTLTSGSGTSTREVKGLVFTLIFLSYFLYPWKYMAGLAMAETSYTFALNLIPYCITFIYRYILNSSYKNAFWAIILISVSLLTHTRILIDLTVGVISIGVAAGLNGNGEIKFRKNYFKKGLKTILISFVAVTSWYGPGFWWVQLSSPGIGGDVGAKVIIKALDFAKQILPFLLAATVVYFRSHFTSRAVVFAAVWTGGFGLLTLFRFLANPAFWMDYTSWITELEMGLWFLSLGLFYTKNKTSLFIITGLSTLLLARIVYVALGSPGLIVFDSPREKLSLEILSGAAGEKRVFLSGSSVFWMNAFYNTEQVRGGRDEVATDRSWARGAYLLRESGKEGEIKTVLVRLGIEYVLVHGSQSEEYYHDFKNINVWPKVGETVASDKGNFIYRVSPGK
jgi:hypothetical protein